MSNFLPNSYQTPNAYVDEFMFLLTGEEWKVLSYATRLIRGFNKDSDRISLSQFRDGQKDADGRVISYGTGLSLNAIRAALKNLIAFNLMKLVNESTPTEAMEYALQLDSSQVNWSALIDRSNKLDAANQRRAEKSAATTRIKNSISSGDRGSSDDTTKDSNTNTELNTTVPNGTVPATPPRPPIGSKVKGFYQGFPTSHPVPPRNPPPNPAPIVEAKETPWSVTAAFMAAFTKSQIPAGVTPRPFLKEAKKIMADGVTAGDMTCAGEVYAAWYNALEVTPMLAWDVGTTILEIRRALLLCKAGITPEKVAKFIQDTLKQVDTKTGKKFWNGHKISFEYVADHIVVQPKEDIRLRPDPTCTRCGGKGSWYDRDKNAQIECACWAPRKAG